jgi:uncharacterized membrane protein
MTYVTVLNIVVAGILAGNEFGTWAVVHRQLATLPTPQHVAAEQALNRRYEKVMPALMLAVLGTGIAAARAAPGGIGSAAGNLALLGTACITAMLAITLAGNVPINRATDHAALDIDPSRWAAMRTRWNRLHDARIILDVAAFTLFVCAGLVAR